MNTLPRRRQARRPGTNSARCAGLVSLPIRCTVAVVDNYNAMAKALAERNRRSRRMYTIMIPFAIAALIAAFVLRLSLRSSMREPPPPAGASYR